MLNPAGAVFPETLEDLSERDRLLLLFSAGANLVGLRWLLRLGANKHACDSKGTTALHAACRAGSELIVEELVSRGAHISRSDCCGWTPLHIAIFMGRTEIVAHLLKVRAPVLVRNNQNQTPLDLCGDQWTQAVIDSYIQHLQKKPDSPWCEKKTDSRPHSRHFRPSVTFCPSMLPQKAAIADDFNQPNFYQFGLRMFSHDPGKGLAFMVASGSVKGTPTEVGRALKVADRGQVGSFLGEPYSLSRVLCCACFASVDLREANMVEALVKAFGSMRMPSELEKIDRLAETLSQTWWEQNHRLHQALLSEADPPSERDIDADEEGADDALPFGSDELPTSQLAVYQLMFSLVILNLHVHRNGFYLFGEDWMGVGCEEMSIPAMGVDEWVEMHRGIGRGRANLERPFLEDLYTAVASAPIPELHLEPKSWFEAVRLGDVAVHPPQATRPIPAWFVAKNFWAGSYAANSERVPVLDVLCEHLGNRGLSPHTDVLFSQPGALLSWLSIYETLLLFSCSACMNEVPFAFIYLPTIQLEPEMGDSCRFCFTGRLAEEGAVENENDDQSEADERSRSLAPGMLRLVVLSSDGRWKDLSLPRLEVRVDDPQVAVQFRDTLQTALFDAHEDANLTI